MGGFLAGSGTIVLLVGALAGCGGENRHSEGGGTTTIGLAGGSMSFKVPAGLREVDYKRPEGAPLPVTAATLRLDGDNQIELTQFRLDVPQAPPTGESSRRSLAEGFAEEVATGFDVETEALRPTEVDGVPGVTLRAHPLEAPSDSEDVSVGYSVFLRGRDLYAIRCESTSSREEELDEACEELLASLRLRPYRPPASEGSPGTSNEDSIPLAEFIQRADSACRKATGEGFAGLTPPAYDREQASAAEMRRLAPFLEDFLAATLDLESDLAALPKPEGREEEWRRALRLEAGVLVPTVRSALRAARRREGREVSSKLNGLGVAVGDLKEAFAAVGLKICSA